MAPMNSGARGFTLIELMITLAIIAILSAVAYPVYTDQIRKSRRAEAKTALLKAAQLQERQYTSEGTYTTDLAPLFGLAANATVLSGENPAEGYYQITAAAGAGGLVQSYVLTATPRAAVFTDPECGNLTLNSYGERAYTGTGTKDRCW